MKSHPGGEAHTLRMLELSGLTAGSRVLDLGAGAGEAVRVLRERGFQAKGLDLAPRSKLVSRGNLLRTGLPDGFFDGVLSQCAFFQSGDVLSALRESARPGGILMLSDVFFTSPRPLLEQAGFCLLHQEDMNEAWKRYLIDAIWRGDFDCCALPRGKSSYCLLIGRKG